MAMAQQQDYFRPPSYGNPGFSIPVQLSNQFHFNNRQMLGQSGNMSWATRNFSERLEAVGSYVNRRQMPNSFQSNREIDPTWSYHSSNQGLPASLQMPVTPQACTMPRAVGSQVPQSFHGMPALGQAQRIPFPAAQPVFHPVNTNVHQPGPSHEQLGLGCHANKEPPSYMQLPHQGYNLGQAHQVPFPGVPIGSGLGNVSQFGFNNEKNSHCDPTFSYSDPGKSFSSQPHTCHQAVAPFHHKQTPVQNWTFEKYQVAKTSQQNVYPIQPVSNLAHMQHQQQSNFSASVHAGHQGCHNAEHQAPVSVYKGGSSEIYGHASIQLHLESREPPEATTERPNSRTVSSEKIKTSRMAKNTSERQTLQTTNADSLDHCMTAQGSSGRADHCHLSNSCPPPSSMPSIRNENTMEKAGNSSLPSVRTDISELEKDVDAGRLVQHSSLSETQHMNRNSRCSSESLIDHYAQPVSKTGVQLEALKSSLYEMLQERRRMFFQKTLRHLLNASKDDSLSSISRSGVNTGHGHEGFVPSRTEPSKNACHCQRNPTLCYLHDPLRSAAMQVGKEKGLPAVESRKVTTNKGQSDSSLANHRSEEDIAWELLEKDIDVMKHMYSSAQRKWNIRGQQESAGFQQSHESSSSFKANAQVDLGMEKSDVHCKDATSDGSVGCYQEVFSPSTELLSRSDTVDQENESDIFDLKCMVCLKTFSSRDEVHRHLSVHLQDKEETNLGEKGDVFVQNTGEVEQEQPVTSTLAQTDNSPLRAASLQSADEEMAPDEEPKQNSAPVEVPEKNSACETCVPAHTGNCHFDVQNEEGARLCESHLSPLWDQRDAVVAQPELDKDESFKCNYSDQCVSNPSKSVTSDAFVRKQSCSEGNEDLDQHTDLKKQDSSSPQEYQESKYDETAQSRNSPGILKHSVKRSWNGKSSSILDCTDRDTTSQPPKNGLEDEAASTANKQSFSGDSLSPVGLISNGVTTSEKKSPHKESTEHQFSPLHQHQVKGLGSTDLRNGRSHVHVKAVQSSHRKTLGHTSEEKCVQERSDHQNKHQSTEDFSRAYIGSCPAAIETAHSNQPQKGDSSSVHHTSLSDSCGTQKSSHTERKSVNVKRKATDSPVHASCKKNLSHGVRSTPARPYCEDGSQVTGTDDGKNCSGAKDTDVQSQMENGSDGMTDYVVNRKPVLSSSQTVNQNDKRNGDTKHSEVPREKILKEPSAKCSVDVGDSFGSLNRDKQKWNLHKSEQPVRRFKEQKGLESENVSDSRHCEKSRKVKQTSAVCAFAERNCNAEQNASSDSILKPEYSVRASLNKDKEEKRSSSIISRHSNVTTLKSESQLSMCKESTKSTSLDQVVAKTDKAKKIVDSLRKIVKFVDWGSRKDGLHVKDVFSTNLAHTQKLTSDILDQGSKVDHAEMKKKETTTNKADSSRNEHIIKEHAAHFRDSRKCERRSSDLSSETISLSSSLHQVSDGRKCKADDNHHDTAPAISGDGNSNRCKSDDTDVVFCSKCMTVFIERGLYEKHGCCKHVDTEHADGEEASIEGPEDIAGKKSVADAVGKRVKRDGGCVERDGTKKRKRREESTDSDSGLSDIHDSDWDPDKGSMRCDLKTKVKAPKKKRRRILQGSEKRKKLEKLARSDCTKKPKNDQVQTMFNCELCDQVFLSRGGLLFHWQAVHMKS